MPSLVHLYVHRFRNRRGLSSAITFGVVVALTLVVLRSRSLKSSLVSKCVVKHTEPDGGDCQAIGEPRRPKWACLSAMREELPRFLSVYRDRPFKSNVGGMRMDHSFALWYVLRHVRPKVVIESGAFNGQSTWIMRKALPEARIISLDPSAPQQILPGVEYHVREKFRDFKATNWKKMGVDPADTVVFLDDHQSAYRRIFMDNSHGFYRFIVEDSYDYLAGDNYSLKWVCERVLKNKWRGTVPDNFGKVNTRQSWAEHLRLGDHLKKVVNVYYEFPPVASSSLTGQKRYKPARASAPIIWDKSEFHLLFGRYKKEEFIMYTHFTYVEVIRDAVGTGKSM